MCQASKQKRNEELLSVAQEIAFAKALAANEKSLRNRALKKLRKWFSQKSRQDSPGLRFTEDGFMRIWKGLFYCVWMSDKPLVQEEIVESISNLIHCFTHLEDVEKFVHCFFLSISQGWMNLDGHRIDKYLMLIRRFLRQIFEYMYKEGWDNECVDALCGVLEKGFIQAPVGLNLHLAEVYIEELAKVGRGELKPSTVLKILKPFAECMAVTSDTRLLQYCVNFIFLQLIRQSDEGIKYGAKFEVWKELGFPEGDIDVIGEASDDDLEEDVSMDEEESAPTSALDPRAGNVDVFLPPVDFDPTHIRHLLTELLRRKDTTTKARNSFNLIIKKYDKFIEGKYPLGIHKCEKPDIEDEEEIIEKKANELAKEDREFALERKMYKKGYKGEGSGAIWEVSPLKETNCFQGKSASNIGNWEVSSVSKRKSKPDDSICASMKKIKITTDDSLVSDLKSEQSNGSFHQSQTLTENAEEETKSGPKKQNRKRRKKATSLPEEKGNENENPQSIDQADIMKIYNFVMDEERRQRQKRKKIEQAKVEWGITDKWNSSNEEEVVIPFSPSVATTSKSAETPVSKTDDVPISKKTPNSGKKVEFVLNRNTAQGEKEYKRSLINSPNIPYDAEKKPLQGVLKASPIGSPINPFLLNSSLL